MLYAGLDLSRQRLDVHVLDEDGRDGRGDRRPAGRRRAPDARGAASCATASEVSAAIESMTGARFVHDTLEFAGWDVAIADAAKVKGIAPLAAKTDKIDARVLAELARRDLVPEIWLPRSERPGRARAGPLPTPPRPPPDRAEEPDPRDPDDLRPPGAGQPTCSGRPGASCSPRLALPEPWATTLATSLRLVDELTAQIDARERELAQARGATTRRSVCS